MGGAIFDLSIAFPMRFTENFSLVTFLDAVLSPRDSSSLSSYCLFFVMCRRVDCAAHIYAHDEGFASGDVSSPWTAAEPAQCSRTATVTQTQYPGAIFKNCGPNNDANSMIHCPISCSCVSVCCRRSLASRNCQCSAHRGRKALSALRTSARSAISA